MEKARQEIKDSYHNYKWIDKEDIHIGKCTDIGGFSYVEVMKSIQVKHLPSGRIRHGRGRCLETAYADALDFLEQCEVERLANLALNHGLKY